MDREGERSRPDQQKLVLHPSSDDFPIAKEMDAETLAEFRAFSEPAKVEARRSILDYASKLIRLSDACRDSLDGYSVSPANVREASVLVKRREGAGGLKKLAGILGGIIAGHGLATLSSVLQGSEFDKKGIILGALFGILGVFLVALDLPRDLLPTRQKRKSAKPPQALKVRRRPARQVSRGQQLGG